ncbi:hypothetical protein [Methylobacterium sp. Leaf465]|uniref:hypothetical protein n=1 Tax=Methylobacterium sp. Leaf465 TaxID=1736385 RepID=UPI0012E3B00C
MGVQALASGLGVTLLGRSFLQAGLRILRAPEPWPAPSITEVVLIGEDRAGALMRPLIAFLTESPAGSEPSPRRPETGRERRLALGGGLP